MNSPLFNILQSLGSMAPQNQPTGDQGFIGNLVGGIVNPMSSAARDTMNLMSMANQIGNIGNPYAGPMVGGFSTPNEQQAFQQDPMRALFQHAANYVNASGTALAPVLPIEGLAGAAGLGAVQGASGAVGQAAPGQDLMSAGLTGGLLGAGTGAAMHGIGGMLGQFAQDARNPVSNSLSEPQLEAMGLGKETIGAKGGFASDTERLAHAQDVQDLFQQKAGQSVGTTSQNIAAHDISLQQTKLDLAKAFQNDQGSINSGDLIPKMDQAIQGLEGNPTAMKTLQQVKDSFVKQFGENTPLSSQQMFDFINKNIDPLVSWGQAGSKTTAANLAYQNIRGALRDTIGGVDANGASYGINPQVSQELENLSTLYKAGGKLGKAYSTMNNVSLPGMRGTRNILPIGEPIQAAKIAVGNFPQNAARAIGSTLGPAAPFLQNPLAQSLAATTAGNMAAGSAPQPQDQLQQQPMDQGQTPMQQNQGQDQRSQIGMELLQRGMKPSEVNAALDVMGFTKPKALSGAQSKVMANAQDAIQGLNSLQSTLKQGNINSPLIGGLRAMNPYDTEAQAAQSKIDLVKEAVAQGVKDGVLRNSDLTRYTRMMPGLNDTQAVAMNKISLLRQELTNKYNTYLQQAQAGGYDVPTQ